MLLDQWDTRSRVKGRHGRHQIEHVQNICSFWFQQWKQDMVRCLEHQRHYFIIHAQVLAALDTLTDNCHILNLCDKRHPQLKRQYKTFTKQAVTVSFEQPRGVQISTSYSNSSPTTAWTLPSFHNPSLPNCMNSGSKRRFTAYPSKSFHSSLQAGTQRNEIRLGGEVPRQPIKKTFVTYRNSLQTNAVILFCQFLTQKRKH